MSRYSAAPHGAAGQVVLTRQGISLSSVTSAVNPLRTWTQATIVPLGGPVVSAGLCMSPCSSDYIFSRFLQSPAYSL